MKLGEFLTAFHDAQKVSIITDSYNEVKNLYGIPREPYAGDWKVCYDLNVLGAFINLQGELVIKITK